MNLKQKLAAFVAVPVAVVSGGAFAAVPTTVSTALTDAGADSATVAGLALAIVIAIYGFKAMRRAL